MNSQFACAQMPPRSDTAAGAHRMIRLASRPRTALFFILIASAILRFGLVWKGGQNYFPDEIRYYRWNLLKHVAQGDLRGGLDFVLEQAQHTGFIFVASAVAPVHKLAIRLLGLPYNWETIKETAWVPALFLCLASVVCIGLTYAVARRAGAGEREALIASVLMASATVLFYYSRHLVPYDASLALALLALWVGLDPRPALWRSVVCGVLAGFAFLTYNAYWLVAGLVLAVHALFRAKSLGQVLARGMVAGLSFAAVPGSLTLASIVRGTKPFIIAMMDFARMWQGGYPPEGWSIPWAFLWHAEHGLLLAWGIGMVALAWFCLKGSQVCQGRGPLWLAVVLGGYLMIALGSMGPTKFAIHGRAARELVPFLSLATACAITALADRWRWGRGVAILGIAVLAGQTLLNFYPPFVQEYPADFERRIKRQFGPVQRGFTLEGPKLEDLWLPEQDRAADVAAATPADESDPSKSRYILYNVKYLAPVYGPKRPRAGTVVARAAHPLQYLPYAYEGYTPTERSILRSTDISMRLIDTRASSQGAEVRSAVSRPGQ